MQTLKAGSSLRHGSYRILKTLGQGGFGITYLAEDLALDRKVAIKEFFPKDFCDRDETSSHVTLGTRNTAGFVNRLKAKFLKEARNIAKFDHPNIIRIHAAFEENNTAYYVMDFIEGESLSILVRRDGPMSRQAAVGYVTKTGKALEYVHNKRINHLDVKPANIMVRRVDNEPVLIDFGLSKQYDSEGHQTSTTPTGISHGYAPMEQYNDGGVREFSPQTDLYSLAATLYYLLAGVVPPQAPSLVDDELTFPASIPQSLVAPIAKAMSSARRNRQETVGRFLTEINSNAPDDSEITTAPMKQNTTGKLAGHEWVDLGLPSGLKWATCNVGASSPSDYGSYFAWGETTTKSSYTKDNSRTYEENFNDIAGDPNYDAARANWGGPWRMPTESEFEELIDKCKWEWTTCGGKEGYKVIGPNGNSIFLPAAGYRYGTSLNYAGTYGYYWSSTPYSGSEGAYFLYFNRSGHSTNWYYRYSGQSVRPVSE